VHFRKQEHQRLAVGPGNAR